MDTSTAVHLVVCLVVRWDASMATMMAARMDKKLADRMVALMGILLVAS